jgi:hypothetical protein
VVRHRRRRGAEARRRRDESPRGPTRALGDGQRGTPRRGARRRRAWGGPVLLTFGTAPQQPGELRLAAAALPAVPGDAASDAQAKAEAAQKAAETAQKAAEAAQAKAEAAQKAAETTQKNAETAQTKAESALADAKTKAAEAQNSATTAAASSNTTSDTATKAQAAVADAKQAAKDAKDSADAAKAAALALTAKPLTPNPGTALFLIGDHFSVHQTRVIIGGKEVDSNDTELLSRQVIKVLLPQPLQVMHDHLNHRNMVDVHIATPYGVTHHLLIPAYFVPAQMPKG